ncbi:SPFH domain-containing protein [Geminocystis sp. NIES-3709]|uniref:SPFH domain-containing protein n=1 Tax=Geminocystis sp. NIES-3709 TaxID=1617448 RepID=UPI0005FC6D0F|nr:SPFH domain-containing protein [Geminocystis sp. NIES-3709]BAQ66194.1 inner membrane protein YqiK [Geminocystis sp. NIES-3709]
MNLKIELTLLSQLNSSSQIITVSSNPPVLAQTNTYNNNSLSWLLPVGIFGGGLIFAVIFTYLLFAKFYRVCNTNEAFVISGPVRNKQVITRAALFFPGFETITIVSLNQVTVPINRGNTREKPLRTKDLLKAIFNGSLQVRVFPEEKSVLNAAMLLGAGKRGEKEILVGENEIKTRVNDILEGHLRDAAAQSNLGELQGKVDTVTTYLREKVKVDLERFGLELLNIAITNIDELNDYDEKNYLDSQAVVTRESIVQKNLKELEQVRQETQTQIAELRLTETEKQLAAERSLTEKELQNTLAVEQLKAENTRQVLEIKETEQAKQELIKVQKAQEIQEGKIISEQLLQEKEIQQQQAIQEAELDRQIAITLKDQDFKTQQILTQQALKEKDIEKQLAIQQAEIGREVALRKKNQELALAEKALIEKEKEVSMAEVLKETAIKTGEENRVKELALITAQRNKETALIAKQGDLEQKRLEAEVEKAIALEKAEAIKTQATATLEEALKKAQGEKAMIEAQNTLSTKAITIQLAEQYMGQFIQVLPEVISALAPQPGVLGSNPIILAGGNQNGQDAGEATKLVMATSAIALITQMLKNPELREFGNKLIDSLSDSHFTAQSNYDENHSFLNKEMENQQMETDAY